MMCSSQKANSKEFEENWDRVFGNVEITDEDMEFIEHREIKHDI